MKKRILLTLTTILTLSLSVFCLTACENPQPTHTHSYTNYVYNNDASCGVDGTETAVCDNGCSETDTRTKLGSALSHSYTEKVASETFKVSDATCTEKAIYNYSCSCGEKGTETFASGEVLPHSFTNYVSDNNAWIYEDGTKTAVCDNGCGETDTKTDVGSKLIPTDASAFDFFNGVIRGLTNYGKTLTKIIIPKKINGVEVTSIGNMAFYDCESLISVVIGNSVTSIGNYAFSDCSSLTSVVIPNSVTDIYNGAFSGCPIESATMPTIAISYIPQSKLKTVVITGGSSIGDYAFYNCRSLTSIVIPNSVTNIYNGAFRDCSSLTSIEIPNSVTSIGEYAFYGCSSLTIYCETESKPSSWDSSWNYSNCPVEWGYKPE